jgi:hypothetical protein
MGRTGLVLYEVEHAALRYFGRSFALCVGIRYTGQRRYIIDAILRRDPKLAHFEANRRNRQVVMGLARPA